MANTGFKGIDVRQTGTALVFRALLQASGGALVTSGTTNLYLMELQSDGTIKTYDFSDNTFKTTACTTENLAMTYRKSNNATTDTGLWTVALATLTGFTAGAIYLARVNNASGSPTDQIREFQFGSDQGDLAVIASGTTGIGYIQSDAEFWKGGLIPAANVIGVPKVDVGYVVGAVAFVSNGTAVAGTSSSITLSSLEPATSGFYVGRQITIVAGTASGQARFITSYNGPTRFATVHRAWDIIPDATSQYTIDSLIETDAYQLAGHNVVLDANNLPSVTVNAYASGQDPATYILSNPANKLATDSTGKVLLQPTQTGVTIPTVTTVTTANLNFSQSVPTSNTSQTVGDALNAARAQGFGKWTWGGTSLTLYAPDGITPVRTFTLDSATAPTVRS